LIAQHVVATRPRRTAVAPAEPLENAVGAYLHVWTYLVEKSYAQTNVALKLRKPTRLHGDSRVRCVTGSGGRRR
jgi:hypothetical protein